MGKEETRGLHAERVKWTRTGKGRSGRVRQNGQIVTLRVQGLGKGNTVFLGGKGGRNEEGGGGGCKFVGPRSGRYEVRLARRL